MKFNSILAVFLLFSSLYGHEGHRHPQKKMQEAEISTRHSVITPNVGSLSWTMDGDVKVFHLIAEPICREFAPGFFVNCWGYNGSSPGPTIEAIEGDRVRILVTNHLNEPTTVHWHGIILPNGMDGVTGLTQKPIPPGETFQYEFTLKQNGTFMYHPHFDEMMQVALGMMGFFIIHPKQGEHPKIDRDFAIFLHEWRIPIGAKTPDPFEMLDFNLFTFNGVLYPKSEPLVVKTNERVRIRLANVMMGSHPIHLHGHEFTVTRKGGKRIPSSAQYSEVTVNVSPGETRDIEFIADNPGDWAFHCHKSHHIMNQMQHDLPNLTGIDKQGIEERIREFFPDFMGLMGINGMGEMFEMYGTNKKMDMGWNIKLPSNLSPIGSPGPFGVIEMGGMFTILKVRDHLTSEADPGWYQHPPGTVAEAVEVEEMSSMQDEMDSIQNASEDKGLESWLSQEEAKGELEVPQEGNWMQSKPEDSMGHEHSSHQKKHFHTQTQESAKPHSMEPEEGRRPQTWSEWIGSFHLIFLHFPIALINMIALSEWLFFRCRKPTFEFSARFMWMAAAILTPITAFLGIIYSNASEYSGLMETFLMWHLSLGIATAVMTITLAFIREHFGVSKFYYLCLAFLFLLVNVTGFFGGQMTFGPFHLLPPI